MLSALCRNNRTLSFFDETGSFILNESNCEDEEREVESVDTDEVLAKISSTEKNVLLPASILRACKTSSMRFDYG